MVENLGVAQPEEQPHPKQHVGGSSPPAQTTATPGVDVFIRRTEDGATTLYFDPYCEDEGSIYIWSEGNYSCDCNRHLFFEKSMGVDLGPEMDCSEGAYRVRLVRGGVVVYDEWEDET